ncbi:MAG: hypothetical protein F6J93_24715 [Oscillatoria sp. SIO1A7]|nr:hypothetical protein [Oscillatoria sp. SIO1A7]
MVAPWLPRGCPGAIWGRGAFGAGEQVNFRLPPKSPSPQVPKSPLPLMMPNARCEHAQCPKKGVGCGV